MYQYHVNLLIYFQHMMRYKAKSNALIEATKKMDNPDHSMQLSMAQALHSMSDIRNVVTKHTQNALCTLFSFWCASRGSTDAGLRMMIMANDVTASFETTGAKERHLTGVSFMATQANGEDLKARANIFFYGERVDDLLDHLRVCIKKLSSIIPDDDTLTGLYIHFPKIIPIDPVMSFLPNVLEPIHQAGQPNTGLLLYRPI